MIYRGELRQMGRLAWPATLSVVSFALMDVVDCVLLGLVGVGSLAGASLAITILGLIVAFPVNMLRAIAPLAAAESGRSQGGHGELRWRQTLGELLRLAVTAPLVLAGPAAALTLAAAWVVARSGLEPGLAEPVRVFLLYRAPALPAELALAAGWALLEGLHDTRSPLLAGVVANASNIALSLLLIPGSFGLPAMGVAGAAIATDLATAAGLLVVGAALAARWRRAARAAPRPLPAPRHAAAPWRAFVELGWPLGVTGLFNISGVMFLAALVARFGATASAVYGIFCRLHAMVLAVPEGLAVAAISMVACALGANRRPLASLRARLAIAAQLVAGSTITAAVVLSRDGWAPLVSPSPAVAGSLGDLLLVFGGILWLEGLTVVLAGVLEASGATRPLLQATILFDLALTSLALAALGPGAREATVYHVWLAKGMVKLGFLAVTAWRLAPAAEAAPRQAAAPRPSWSISAPAPSGDLVAGPVTLVVSAQRAPPRARPS